MTSLAFLHIQDVLIICRNASQIRCFFQWKRCPSSEAWHCMGHGVLHWSTSAVVELPFELEQIKQIRPSHKLASDLRYGFWFLLRRNCWQLWGSLPALPLVLHTLEGLCHSRLCWSFAERFGSEKAALSLAGKPLFSGKVERGKDATTGESATEEKTRCLLPWSWFWCPGHLQVCQHNRHWTNKTVRRFKAVGRMKHLFAIYYPCMLILDYSGNWYVHMYILVAFLSRDIGHSDSLGMTIWRALPIFVIQCFWAPGCTAIDHPANS